MAADRADVAALHEKVVAAGCRVIFAPRELAAMADEELDRYFASSTREAFTPATINGEVELRQQIAVIRDGAIARTSEEHTPRIVGLGRVAGLRGEVVGAFGVAFPLVRADPELVRRAESLLIRSTELLMDE